MSGRALFSIGYEKRAQADVIADLLRAGVRVVIDVRDRPLSRRAGFSKRQLAASLAEAGLEYVHLKPLGTPPEGREAHHRRQWDKFWRIVAARLATPEAEAALMEVAARAAEKPCCLLCYEADWHICHRRRVGEILAARHGFVPHHLTPPP